MDGVKFEINDKTLLLYKKNDSEQRQRSAYDITKYLYLMIL